MSTAVATRRIKADKFKQMSMIEQAEVVANLLEDNHKQSDIAEMMGVSFAQISNLKKIYMFPAALKQAIVDGKVSATMALGLVRDEKDMTDDDVAKLIKGLVRTSGGHVTKKDFFREQGRHNSFSILKSWLKRNNLSSIRDTQAARATYTLLEGLNSGKITDADLNRLMKDAK